MRSAWAHAPVDAMNKGSLSQPTLSVSPPWEQVSEYIHRDVGKPLSLELSDINAMSFQCEPVSNGFPSDGDGKPVSYDSPPAPQLSDYIHRNAAVAMSNASNQEGSILSAIKVFP